MILVFVSLYINFEFKVMLALVPAVPRFIVLYGFARRYRRKTTLLWGDGPASRIPSLSLGSLRDLP